MSTVDKQSLIILHGDTNHPQREWDIKHFQFPTRSYAVTSIYWSAATRTPFSSSILASSPF